ncbi:MAG: Fe-S cluster assembly ATPase SufC [Brockia lithotrophica]|nr:Fe-S cluster assembly ATPase SufC [Brockia lithotrophica]
MAQPELVIEDLHVSVDGKPIVRGFSLTMRGGEIHAIMGPNGAGKSTVAQAIMGHPRYEVTRGRVLLNGEDLLQLSVDERARRGLFLAMQYPSEIPGVTNSDFLRAAINARRPADNPLPLTEFMKQLNEALALLEMDVKMAGRSVNEGFSGGEKKRNEILQMLLLKPTVAILDEVDSGLDIDALKVVARGITHLASPERIFLLITHYERILQYVEPHYVHVMMQGRIVKSGGPELARELEARGYDWIREELGITDEVVGQEA